MFLSLQSFGYNPRLPIYRNNFAMEFEKFLDAPNLSGREHRLSIEMLQRVLVGVYDN